MQFQYSFQRRLSVGVVQVKAMPRVCALAARQVAAEHDNVMSFPCHAAAEARSALERNVHCLLGMPIDAVDFDQAINRVAESVRTRKPCFFSTPNLNFLVASQGDAAFRESLVNSDLSLVDGLPLAWMARRLGIPLRRRVTGSGLFEKLIALEPEATEAQPSVFFFGGEEGVADMASRRLNGMACGLRGAGGLSPGFGTVEEMSTPEIIDRINASGADFVVVSLGARKGQVWIERNRTRLSAPIVSHLGAVVNFVAGTVERAPSWIQYSGFEWLWRIKEEPALWRRYWHDGLSSAKLVVTRLLPHVLWRWSLRLGWLGKRREFAAELQNGEHVQPRLVIVGDVPDQVPTTLRNDLKQVVSTRGVVIVDLTEADYLSPAFFGLVLVLRKYQTELGGTLRFVGLSQRMRRLFRWNCVEFLLDEPASSGVVQVVQLPAEPVQAVRLG